MAICFGYNVFRSLLGILIQVCQCLGENFFVIHKQTGRVVYLHRNHQHVAAFHGYNVFASLLIILIQVCQCLGENFFVKHKQTGRVVYLHRNHQHVVAFHVPSQRYTSGLHLIIKWRCAYVQFHAWLRLFVIWCKIWLLHKSSHAINVDFI